MSFKLTKPLPFSVVDPQLQTFTGVVASEMAFVLFEELARGYRSGPIYSEYGSQYPASVPGEPEQEQSGALRRSVSTRAEASDGLLFAFSFGFYDEEPEKLFRLEIDEESPTYRGTLERIATDKTIQDYATTEGLLALE